MKPDSAITLLGLGIFLLFLGYINLKGDVRAKKWVNRVLALVLLGVIMVLLDAVTLLAAGLGCVIGALVLAAIFQPWRSD